MTGVWLAGSNIGDSGWVRDASQDHEARQNNVQGLPAGKWAEAYHVPPSMAPAGRRRRRTLKDYCPRIMMRGSAVSGTRRHCALSSASNCQVSPLADSSSIRP